jgi:hypothetical protein
VPYSQTFVILSLITHKLCAMPRFTVVICLGRID